MHNGRTAFKRQRAIFSHWHSLFSRYTPRSFTYPPPGMAWLWAPPEHSITLTTSDPLAVNRCHVANSAQLDGSWNSGSTFFLRLTSKALCQR